MHDFAQVRSVSLPLPEDILKKKWAGDFEGALRLIDARLRADAAPLVLKERLAVERDIIARLPAEYPYATEEALAVMRKSIPDFSREEFDALELAGRLDYIYVRGEKRYFRRFADTLFSTHPDLRARAGRKGSEKPALLNEVIREVAETGAARRRIHLRATLRVKDAAFVPGATYRVHLPVPAKAPQMSGINLLSFSHTPRVIAPEDAAQRTVFFEEKLLRNETFSVEYAYDCRIARDMRYDAPAPGPEDLAEHAPHILFTPFMRRLAEELAEGRATPMEKARAFYDFVTTRVRYSFVREYFLIDGAGEYAAVNGKGDCGLQALCFITLCRVAGIPARWQSGLYAAPDSAGAHDWAQFYTEEGGWRFCDPSFGGSAYEQGDETRRLFYFGNLDPYRMVANHVYYAPFLPEKRFPRIDPYDNQTGECETDARGFNDDELETTQTVIG